MFSMGPYLNSIVATTFHYSGQYLGTKLALNMEDNFFPQRTTIDSNALCSQREGLNSLKLLNANNNQCPLSQELVCLVSLPPCTHQRGCGFSSSKEQVK